MSEVTDQVSTREEIIRQEDQRNPQWIFKFFQEGRRERQYQKLHNNTSGVKVLLHRQPSLGNHKTLRKRVKFDDHQKSKGVSKGQVTLQRDKPSPFCELPNAISDFMCKDRIGEPSSSGARQLG
ncbi:hypothetical protein NPIL_164701 [Nephila pilipes]|uniref:Uncharacterized protein n=1 Tax=Nephila pilipes TaxID=299642 RepID=A0A8X6TMZ4_NEPPI|nr:hypothetical protein NPIL_164701 [Nephila pilipes]